MRLWLIEKLNKTAYFRSIRTSIRIWNRNNKNRYYTIRGSLEAKEAGIHQLGPRIPAAPTDHIKYTIWFIYLINKTIKQHNYYLSFISYVFTLFFVLSVIVLKFCIVFLELFHLLSRIISQEAWVFLFLEFVGFFRISVSIRDT